MYSLVFNGGIAITKNDHTHAAKIYSVYLAEPKKYDEMHKANEKSWDPIHPENHFGPLGIK